MSVYIQQTYHKLVINEGVALCSFCDQVRLPGMLGARSDHQHCSDVCRGANFNLEVSSSSRAVTYRLLRTCGVLLDPLRSTRFHRSIAGGNLEEDFLHGYGRGLLIFDEKDALAVQSEPRRIEGNITFFGWDHFYTIRVAEEVILGVDF